MKNSVYKEIIDLCLEQYKTANVLSKKELGHLNNTLVNAIKLYIRAKNSKVESFEYEALANVENILKMEFNFYDALHGRQKAYFFKRFIFEKYFNMVIF